MEGRDGSGVATVRRIGCSPGVSSYEKARPSTWSLAFFTPPLLRDKVSGNLEYSLLRPKPARSSTFSPQTRPLQSQVRLSRSMAARLIGDVLRYHQIGAHEPQHLSR